MSGTPSRPARTHLPREMSGDILSHTQASLSSLTKRNEWDPPTHTHQASPSPLTKREPVLLHQPDFLCLVPSILVRLGAKRMSPNQQNPPAPELM